jgi:hypothetical protein
MGKEGGNMEEHTDFEFMVEQLADGSYVAQSPAACIVTEATDLDELRREVRDAVCCHFDEGCRPVRVRLRFIEVVREEILEP